MFQKIRPDGVDLLAAALCTAGLFSPGFLLHKANRLVSGDQMALADITGVPFYIFIVIIITTLAFSGRLKDLLTLFRVLLLSAVMVYTTYASAETAEKIMAESMFARVSFSKGYWLFFLGIFLFYIKSYSSAGSRFYRILYSSFFYIPLAALIFSGSINSMSVMQEYLNYESRFSAEMVTHIAISFGSVFLACLAGVPLGIYAARKDYIGKRIFDFLNIVQTIPSIALFGLLMVPLAWLASNSGFLKSAGVGGIGFTPAVIALFLYSLLPVVRNTFEGIKSIDTGITDAAKGMGMTGAHMLFKIELPLSLPVILNGIRVALVQSIGNTAVASLIGAGGMGLFIFQGLGQSAVPLIMLGTIPTILLAVAADSFMHTIISFSKGAAND